MSIWKETKITEQIAHVFRSQEASIWRTKLFIGNLKMNLQFISFYTDMTDAVKILPRVRQELTYRFYIVNIMGVDVLAMQGARASAAMIFTLVNQIPCTLRVNIQYNIDGLMSDCIIASASTMHRTKSHIKPLQCGKYHACIFYFIQW